LREMATSLSSSWTHPADLLRPSCITRSPRLSSFSGGIIEGGWECRLQLLICRSHPKADLKRKGASDEGGKPSECAVGVLVCPWRTCCGYGKLGEISGANVTVSRTHTGFSLCFQIITTLNRFGDKQGRALFSDTWEQQRISCAPKFKITGV
jgi:hypothetical protein